MKLKRMAGAAAVLLLLAVCTGALAADTGIITADGVNLRESPDKESNALGTLELGERAVDERRGGPGGLHSHQRPRPAR